MLRDDAAAVAALAGTVSEMMRRRRWQPTRCAGLALLLLADFLPVSSQREQRREDSRNNKQRVRKVWFWCCLCGAHVLPPSPQCCKWAPSAVVVVVVAVKGR